MELVLRMPANFRSAAVAAAATVALGASSHAGGYRPAMDVARLADPESIVLAVLAPFATRGGDVRVAVYPDAESFLERAALKESAPVDQDGVAVVRLRDLNPGPYAFVAYYDANGDGMLNRGGVLGKPKEPFAFSNGVKPKLRKPRFDETAIEVEPGAVVVLTLEE